MSSRKILGLMLAMILSFPPLSSDGAVLAADLKEAVEQLAIQLSRSLPEGRTLRVAVTDFPDLQGITSDLGRYIAERLTTRLSAQVQKFRVVERRRLTQVLGELGFTMSGLVDPNKAKQLGKMLGVEAIVVGTVSDLGNVVDVDARIIEIETNNILPGVTVAIGTDTTVRQLIERGREMPARSEGIAPAGSPSTISLGTVKYQEFPRFRVEVDGLKVGRGGTITVFLTYHNKTREDLLIGRMLDTNPFPNQNKIFVLDSDGNRYDFEASSGVDDVHWRGKEPLTIGPNMKATASFHFRASQGIEQATLKGRTFSFTSEQSIVKKSMECGYQCYKPVSTYNISIRDIEPR
jgi:TolB-like protein